MGFSLTVWVMRCNCLPVIPDSTLRVLTTYLNLVFEPENPLCCLFSRPIVFGVSSMSTFFKIDYGLYLMTEPRSILFDSKSKILVKYWLLSGMIRTEAASLGSTDWELRLCYQQSLSSKEMSRFYMVHPSYIFLEAVALPELLILPIANDDSSATTKDYFWIL